MAIAFDAASSTNPFQPSGSISWSHTCTGANRILLVYVTGTLDTFSVSSITYGGVSLTKIGNYRASELWYLIAPATGTNTIVVTASNFGNYPVGYGASYTGAAQSLQPDAHTATGGGSGTAQPYSVPLTTIADNCWVVSGALWTGTSGGPDTPQAGTTIRAESSGAFGNNYSSFLDSGGPVSPAGSKTLSWQPNGGGADWEFVAASIAPAAAGGTAYTFTPAGGLVGGGTSSPATAYHTAPSGGLVAGGLAGVVAAYTDTPSGGLVGGGQADVATTGNSTYTPAGGLVGGGTSAVTTDYHTAPSGGLVAGGAADFAQQTSYSPAGGLIGGGTAVWTLGYAPTPGGGLVGGGSAGFVWSATFGPSGGLVGGGAATVVYVSGSVPAPPATFLWVADAGGRTWYSLPVARVWYAEGRAGDVGRVRNQIEEESGMDKVSLGMDFGDLAEVRAGHKVTSCTVTVPGGVTYTGVAVEANGYRVDALFSSSTPGTYSVVFTAILDTTPASTVVRTGTLIID